MSFSYHRDLKSKSFTTRTNNPISHRTMSMTLSMIPPPSSESINLLIAQTVRLSQNPSVEGELFADLAHAALDGATLLSLSPIPLSLFIFVGRIFAILGDYLPDHYMTPDETIFQLSMLLFSSRPLYNNIISLISSTTKSISFKDRKVYLIAFLPFGFSWMQYKLLISNALEWVDLPPGKCLQEENDSLFITYRGDVYEDVDGFNIRYYGTRSQTKKLDIIGDLSMAKELIDSKLYGKRRIRNVKSTTIDSIEQPRSQYKLRAGLDGSLLLRIKVDKILEIANEDEQLFGSIQGLVLNGITNRLIMQSKNI